MDKPNFVFQPLPPLRFEPGWPLNTQPCLGDLSIYLVHTIFLSRNLLWLVDDDNLEIGWFVIYVEKRAHDVADKDGGFCYLSYPSMIRLLQY